MNNLSSYCGLVDAKIRASDKDLPVLHDSTKKKVLSKHKVKAESKCLDDSEVLSIDFPGLKNSAALMTSVASTASMASMTSTASFHQKKY